MEDCASSTCGEDGHEERNSGRKLGICSDANDNKDNLNLGLEKNRLDESIIGIEVTDTDTNGNCQINQQLSHNIQKCGYTFPERYLSKIVPMIQTFEVDEMTCHATKASQSAAFLIPIINRFLEENVISNSEEGSSPVKPECVIITPTRESAAQISTLAKMLTEATNISFVAASGNTSVQQQMEDARRGCNILISTPGRLLYFVQNNIISFKSLRVLVLDEADRLMTDDFQDCIDKIANSETMPRIKDRQTFIHCKKLDEETQERVKMFLDDSYLLVDEELLRNIELIC